MLSHRYAQESLASVIICLYHLRHFFIFEFSGVMAIASHVAGIKYWIGVDPWNSSVRIKIGSSGVYKVHIYQRMSGIS